MDDDKNITVRWSGLPPELWAMIGRCLGSHTDLLRFRSVCATWRSLVPPLPPPHSPIPVPYPDPRVLVSSASISVATVLLLEPVAGTSPLDGPIPSRQTQGWLIKIADSNPETAMESESTSGSGSVTEPKPGKIRLLNPLCSLPIHFKPGTFPKHLDLLKFRVTEICKEYSLRGPNRVTLPEVEKVLIYPNPNSLWQDPEDTVALAVNKDGSLRYWKHGDELWTSITIDDQNQETQFDDIIIYKGQFYAVDKLGTVSWLDSSMRPVQFSPPMCGGGHRKHLIESGGEIFVIDQYNEGAGYFGIDWHEEGPDRNHRSGEAVDFKVYRLDQEWGKWDEVRDLGAAAFFIGASCCFSVPVRDFNGCLGNCIYFVEGQGLLERVHVFSLGDRSIKRAAFLPAYLQILWPPPSWVAYPNVLEESQQAYNRVRHLFLPSERQNLLD